MELQGFVQMKDRDFDKLSEFIYSKYGIKIPIAKKILLETRLQKRLRALGINCFKEYLNKVIHDKEEEETRRMIEQVSTNTTDFFRERDHFEFLKKEILPKWKEREQMKIWSAATSSGEEAYSIAITIQEFNSLKNIVIPYEITATDISEKILKQGASGTYSYDRVSALPHEILKKYFLKSHDKKYVKVVKEIRNKITFARHNLMDQIYPKGKRFDIIFCRNVLIYFDRETQRKVITKLYERLEPGGYLFLGHSESIFGMNLPLIQKAHTTYQKSI